MSKVISHWDTRATLPCTPIQYLQTLSQVIMDHQLPFVHTEAVRYQGGRAGDRIYLRVRHRRHFVDVGAAPYGRQMFISVWLHEEMSFWFNLQELFAKLWLGIGKAADNGSMLGRLNRRTGEWAYENWSPHTQNVYQQDEVSMFYDTIGAIVQDVITDLSQTRGRRRRKLR